MYLPPIKGQSGIALKMAPYSDWPMKRKNLIRGTRAAEFNQWKTHLLCVVLEEEALNLIYLPVTLEIFFLIRLFLFLRTTYRNFVLLQPQSAPPP